MFLFFKFTCYVYEGIRYTSVCAWKGMSMGADLFGCEQKKGIGIQLGDCRVMNLWVMRKMQAKSTYVVEVNNFNQHLLA